MSTLSKEKTLMLIIIININDNDITNIISYDRDVNNQSDSECRCETSEADRSGDINSVNRNSETSYTRSRSITCQSVADDENADEDKMWQRVDPFNENSVSTTNKYFCVKPSVVFRWI